MLKPNEKLKPCAYELRYFQAILAIGDPNFLLDLKADLVMNKRVRYPQGLKIVDSYGFDWVFDENFTSYTASVYLADKILPTLLNHKEVIYHEKTL